MMQGFKQFIESVSSDINHICTHLLSGKDTEVYLDMLHKYMLDIGNDLKASYVEKVIENPRRDQPYGQFTVEELAFTGRHGFCTPLGLGNYESYKYEEREPSLQFKTLFHYTPIIGHVPYKYEVIQSAINKQMGLGQYTNEVIDVNQLELKHIYLSNAEGGVPPTIEERNKRMEFVEEMLTRGSDIIIHTTAGGKRYNRVIWDLENHFNMVDLVKQRS